ncbi:hypothetical protein [Saccharicrinis fermentans]|uniref:Uncharacterized protein n=1 Tax=Saccharicrinis fermentans DSM 9555 = JCM 21142 TaxID=869213 RepID=W7YEL8_9BACT|nr:hypothetical protein [Saccharicrinis fermentans]GAF02896.1 hypothetical protein JCM21142_41545 [Saccharicrinis fermentans DSM 9555 = JCM 21142]
MIFIPAFLRPYGSNTFHFTISLFCLPGCNPPSDLSFANRLPEKFHKENIISEDDYNVWGTNILKGKDGKYHAIYSRWPKSRGI